MEKYGITKQVKISLARTPVPGSASTASSPSSQVHNQVTLADRKNCCTITDIVIVHL